MRPFFDETVPFPRWEGPLPAAFAQRSTVCVRADDLRDDNVPIGSRAYRAMLQLDPLIKEAFETLFSTGAYLTDERSPFAECDYRICLESVQGYHCHTHRDDDADRTLVFNLTVIACDLLALLQTYTPHWRGVPAAKRPALLLVQAALVARATRLVEALLTGRCA